MPDSLLHLLHSSPELLSREWTPPSSTNFLGRLRGSLEASRARCSCRTETVASARDPDEPEHSSAGSNNPGACGARRQGKRRDRGCL